MKIGKARRAGIALALQIVDERVKACAESAAIWKAKFKAGECEVISYSTEQSALLEAELIAFSIRRLLVHGDLPTISESEGD